MRSPTIVTCGLLAAIFAFLGSPVIADDCNSESPLKTLSGEDYFNVTSQPDWRTRGTDLLNADPQIVALLEHLASNEFRTGSGTSYICMPNSENAKIWREFSLQDITRSTLANGLVKLKFLKHDRANKTLSAEQVFLPSSSQWQANTDTSLATSTVLRRRNVRSGGYYLNETALRIEATSAGMTLTKTTYINGHKAGWMVLNFDS